jgi:hypothetical protein
MTDPLPPPQSFALSSESLSQPSVLPAAVRPAGYAAPAQFLELAHPDDRDLLLQLAAQLLSDSLAVQRLSDRVVELLQQDLRLQHERNFGCNFGNGRRR